MTWYIPNIFRRRQNVSKVTPKTKPGEDPIYTYYNLKGCFIKETDVLSVDNFTGIIKNNRGKYTIYYFKGQWHRLDGPATKWLDGSEEYYIHDKEYTKEQHALLADIMKLKGLIK